MTEKATENYFKGPSTEEFFAPEQLKLSRKQLHSLTYGEDKRKISKISGTEAIARSEVGNAFIKHFNILIVDENI